MELQSASSGLPLSPGPLSPSLDFAGPLSPSPGGPGPSHHSPGRGPSPSFSGQAAFNYNQLEGRFKQLQGKSGKTRSNALLCPQMSLSQPFHSFSFLFITKQNHLRPVKTAPLLRNNFRKSCSEKCPTSIKVREKFECQNKSENNVRKVVQKL